MSDRDQLEHDLGESLWALDPPPEECGPDSRGWADAEDRNRERVGAVLAVLDQQGWAQDCPTVEATEPSSPEGTAALLGTPQIEDLRQAIDRALPTSCVVWNGTRFFGEWQADHRDEAIVRVADAVAALREAARYEPTLACLKNIVAGWVAEDIEEPAGLTGYWYRVGQWEPMTEAEQEVMASLYRRVTTDEGEE